MRKSNCQSWLSYLSHLFTYFRTRRTCLFSTPNSFPLVYLSTYLPTYLPYLHMYALYHKKATPLLACRWQISAAGRQMLTPSSATLISYRRLVGATRLVIERRISVVDSSGTAYHPFAYSPSTLGTFTLNPSHRRGWSRPMTQW